MEKVRMGVIGLGGMGQVHMNKIKEIPEAELTAISDVDSEITKGLDAPAQEVAIRPTGA